MAYCADLWLQRERQEQLADSQRDQIIVMAGLGTLGNEPKGLDCRRLHRTARTHARTVRYREVGMMYM